MHTKSDLILRDININIIEEINAKSKAVAQMTLTTADKNLCRGIEPAVCTTDGRAKVLVECRKRKIPTVMWLSPFLPFINDTEQNVRRLMEICIQKKVFEYLNTFPEEKQDTSQGMFEF